MDLKQLEYIIKIAEENNITRAAEKLYITQSALNQQLLRFFVNAHGDMTICNQLSFIDSQNQPGHRAMLFIGQNPAAPLFFNMIFHCGLLLISNAEPD